MKNPKVSIVIPTYNIEKYIAKCLYSLINQTYQNLEIIVIDDGSLDNTWNVICSISSTDDRVKPIRQSNGRTAKARNNGLSKVSGELLMFVDGDDYLSPNCIYDNVRYFEEDNDLDWVSFSVIRVDENGQKIIKSKTYNNFVVKNNHIIEHNDMLNAYQSQELSGLCCGVIYKWKTIKDMRFPVGEFYEDNFYFLETLWKTNKGMLSNKGIYYYLERNGSSQFAQMDRAHLLSCLHNETRALVHFRKHFNEQSELIDKMEDASYYYLKSFYTKGVEGSKDVLEEFMMNFNVPHRVNYKYEIICIIHKMLRFLSNKK